MVPMAFPVAFPIPLLGKIPSLVEEESQVVRIKWILNDHDHDDTNIPSFDVFCSVEHGLGKTGLDVRSLDGSRLPRWIHRPD